VALFLWNLNSRCLFFRCVANIHICALNDGELFDFEFVVVHRATQTRILQRIWFTTMESLCLLSLETDCRLWIVSLCVEGTYCLFDRPSSGLGIFPIVWTTRLFQCIVVHSGQGKLSSGQIFLGFMKSPWSIHTKAGDWDPWRKFLRRIRDVGFARKQIEKYAQGVRTMMTLWPCK
jgi:hypothetical protein